MNTTTIPTAPSPAEITPIFRVEVSTPAPSRIPKDFPTAIFEIEPAWRNMFVHTAQFLAMFETPISPDQCPVKIIQLFSLYPEGQGQWAEQPYSTVISGKTAQEKLDNFIARIKEVYGENCSIRFVAMKTD